MNIMSYEIHPKIYPVKNIKDNQYSSHKIKPSTNKREKSHTEIKFKEILDKKIKEMR